MTAKKCLQKSPRCGIIFLVDGDVAQLGEHQVRNLGVEGSIPFVSTISDTASRRKCFRVHGKQYGIRAQVNNIYTVGDYFFIDFSLQNKSNIKYDIAEIRLKLLDKKELKATNSQTIELTPVYMVNHADHFTKSYRNVIVLKKLTFPEEKKLRLEITEDQISGRASYQIGRASCRERV